MVPDRRTRGGCAARPFSGTIPTAKADAWASNQATSTRNMAADLRRDRASTEFPPLSYRAHRMPRNLTTECFGRPDARPIIRAPYRKRIAAFATNSAKHRRAVHSGTIIRITKS